MLQVLVFIAVGHSQNYALLPRKSHIHHLALGGSLRFPLNGRSQEVWLAGPGMLRVSAQRREPRGVRVYVREAGGIDEVVTLAESNTAELLVTVPRGPHSIEIVADADVPGAITATFASHLTAALPSAPSEGAPTPQISPEISSGAPTPQISDVIVKGRPETARLDSGETVFIVKPGRPLRLALGPKVTGIHLLMWRALDRSSTRLIVHGDGRLLMSAVLTATVAGEHRDGDISLAVAEDLFIEPVPGTRQLAVSSDSELAAALAK